jgi:NADPH2:quinone reductase
MSALPRTMKAIEISRPGGPEVLVEVDRPLPAIGEHDILIRVHAAGVNRPDVLQRKGHYPVPPGASDLPGLEVAGEVVEIGSGVTQWQPGDLVCALCNGGGYAEYCAVPAGQALRAPDRLDMAQAAALPETFFTVWVNVFQRARLKPGETLLVHGGTSGIGTTAIQLAKAMGSSVFATAGGLDKARACERLGAARGIDYLHEDFVEVIRELTGAKGVDVILDMVGGDYTPRNLEALAIDGRLSQIAFLRGPKVEIGLDIVTRKRLTLTGSTLRPRSSEDKAKVAAELNDRVWPLIEQGRVEPVIHETFPLAQAAEAHRLLETNTHIGKIVLVVSQNRLG